MADLVQAQQAENQVRRFYEGAGWSENDSGVTGDAERWEDLRPCAENYVSACRLRILCKLPRQGSELLDAASGPIQYIEYFEFSKNFNKRVCVDLSEKALESARKKLGERGEYYQLSILDLPFESNRFDASLSLHTIYHIHKDEQERAVRQLLRTTKPGAPLIVLYANPDRFFVWVKKVLLRKKVQEEFLEPLYYFAHPLSWWDRFRDEAEVEILPWRSLTAQDSRRLILNNGIGRLSLELLFRLEKLFPRFFVRWGAYPMIILRKRASL